MNPPTQRVADVFEITLTMSEKAVFHFLPFFGEGILLKGTIGATVEDFLVNTAGVPATYLKERVQTVFLNGKALDDFRSARLMDGATLALSAAMPGLAGAVLRCGGVYAAMRRQISHNSQWPNAGGGEVLVTLKLFNLIARELGPQFLKEGVLVPGVRLRDYLERQGRWAWDGCLSAEADGSPVKTDRLVELIAKHPWIRLSVHTSV